MRLIKNKLAIAMQIFVLGIVILFIGIENAEADCDSNSEVQCSWYFSWSCPGCGKIGGATSGTQGPYSSAGQCNSARGRIRSPVSAGSCYKRGACNVTRPKPIGPTAAEREAARKRKEKAEEEKKRKKQQEEAEKRRRFNQEKNEALKQLKGRIRDLDNDDSETIKLKSGTVFDTGLKPINTLKLKGTGKSVNTPTLKGTGNSKLGLKQPRFSKGTKSSAPVSAEEFDAATGKAFTEGQKLRDQVEAIRWPLQVKAAFLLGVDQAEQGSYERAVSYFKTALRLVPSEPWITAALEHIRGLQAVQAARKGAGPIAWGTLDPETVGALPKAARDRVLIAMSLVDVGDFERATGLLNEALESAPSDRDLHGAASYVNQLLAQKRERESPLSEQEKTKRVVTARAKGRRNAAMALGNHLLNSGDLARAIVYFKEARKGFSPDSSSYSLLSDQIASPGDFTPIPELLLYQSKGEAILDALQYGDGNWDRSIRYLKTANKADPKNLFVRDALNYVQGMTVYAEQQKK